ncbi:hypothetical protein ABFS83_12G035400 [Erythranthe nasuta]
MSEPPPETAVQEQEQQSYPLHSINSAVVIRQLPSQGLSFQLWPAATTLYTLLDRHRSGDAAQPTPLSALLTSPDRRLRILELGSGTGLVGIAAAALLGATVTVTDLPRVLPNLQYNVDANAGILAAAGGGGTVGVAALAWGDRSHMEAVGVDYDIVLGSDVVYHDNLYEPLLQTLKFFLLESEKRIVFVMAHLKRWKKESAFFKKAKKLFDVDVIHTDSPSDGGRVGVNVYRFVRRG